MSCGIDRRSNSRGIYNKIDSQPAKRTLHNRDCRMKRILSCFAFKPAVPYTLETYNSAGVVFTDGTHVLAGYQPNKKKPFVSGIGGRKEEGETYMDTALREGMEELFEFKDVPVALTKDIRQSIPPKNVLLTGGYVSVVYSFDDLHAVLRLLKQHSLQSELYDTLPSDLLELVFRRKLLQRTYEISHLCILPIVDHNLKNPFLDTYFLMDFPKLMCDKKEPTRDPMGKNRL